MTGPAPMPVAVVGWSLCLPDSDLPARLPAATGLPGAAEPADPPRLLGRKGLLGKDEATRLALCAAHLALGRTPGQPRPGGPVAPGTAVVASSNLGNLGVVAAVTRTVRRDGRRGVSPLDAPGASSNVLASAVAIWFRCGGANLMVCSGAASGLDAIGLGVLLLRAGRADRVLVVGAEPGDDLAVAVHARGAAGPPLRAGAACVVLERAGCPLGTGRPGVLLRAGPGPVRVAAGADRGAPVLLRSGARLDAVELWGDLYGGQGVAQLALAAELLCARPDGDVARLVCGDRHDGFRELEVYSSDGLW